MDKLLLLMPQLKNFFELYLSYQILFIICKFTCYDIVMILSKSIIQLVSQCKCNLINIELYTIISNYCPYVEPHYQFAYILFILIHKVVIRRVVRMSLDHLEFSSNIALLTGVREGEIESEKSFFFISSNITLSSSSCSM